MPVSSIDTLFCAACYPTHGDGKMFCKGCMGKSAEVLEANAEDIGKDGIHK